MCFWTPGARTLASYYTLLLASVCVCVSLEHHASHLQVNGNIYYPRLNGVEATCIFQAELTTRTTRSSITSRGTWMSHGILEAMAQSKTIREEATSGSYK